MGCSDKERFALELEFVQCLANPQYLNCEPGWLRAAPRGAGLAAGSGCANRGGGAALCSAGLTCGERAGK